MTETSIANFFYLLAIVGGPIVLALVMGYAILKRRRARANPPDRQAGGPMPPPSGR